MPYISIYTILNNHPEIKFCEKTIYNYIEMRPFKDCDVTNLTLKRKVKRRLPKKIFYCDPMQSSHKPHVENHNFIREILPYGHSWNHLTQEKLNLMFSHINSKPR